MLSREQAHNNTKDAEEKEIEDKITAAITAREYRVEVLNLTEYQQKVLTDSGYKLTDTVNRLGKVFIIQWDA